MSIYATLQGVGSYLPVQIVTNDDLAERLETSDEWIQTRTGIAQRHIAAKDETTADMAVIAAQRALENARMRADQIDLIILATTTPNYTFPATATLVQARLGIFDGAAFDIQAVCCGFIYALEVAQSMLKTQSARNCLVIGSETFSRILDWEDRGTCVLFGDGAGAFILSAEMSDTPTGILSSFLRSDGRYREMLYVDGGVSTTQTVGHVRMEGRQVFRHAVREISNAMQSCADKVNIPIDEIDWFIPHQANQRILDGVAKQLCIDPEKVVTTLHGHANTSAASVPLAFDCARQDGRIKTGDLVMLEAFGGGFAWGAILLRV